MQTSQQLAQDYIQTVGGTVSDWRKRRALANANGVALLSLCAQVSARIRW